MENVRKLRKLLAILTIVVLVVVAFSGIFYFEQHSQNTKISLGPPIYLSILPQTHISQISTEKQQ